MESEKIIDTIKNILKGQFSRKNGEISLLNVFNLSQERAKLYLKEQDSLELAINKIYEREKSSAHYHIQEGGNDTNLEKITIYSPTSSNFIVKIDNDDIFIRNCDNEHVIALISNFASIHHKNYPFMMDYKCTLLANGLNLFFEKKGITISSGDSSNAPFCLEFSYGDKKVKNKSTSMNIRNLISGHEEKIFNNLMIPIEKLPIHIKQALEDTEKPLIAEVIEDDINFDFLDTEKYEELVNDTYSNEIPYEENITIENFSLDKVKDVPEDINVILSYGENAREMLAQIVTKLLALSNTSTVPESLKLISDMAEVVNPNSKDNIIQTWKNIISNILNGKNPDGININALIEYRTGLKTNTNRLFKELYSFAYNGQLLLNYFIPLMEKYVEKCDIALSVPDIKSERKDTVEKKKNDFRKSIAIANQGLGTLAINIKAHQDTIGRSYEILNSFYPLVGLQGVLFNGLSQQNLSLRSSKALKGLYYGYLQGNYALMKKNRLLLEDSKNNKDGDLITSALKQVTDMIDINEKPAMIEAPKDDVEEAKTLLLSMPEYVKTTKKDELGTN